MCRPPRNVRQTSRQISTTASIATYRRYLSHSCYEASDKAHSTTSPMPTAMGQSFIITLYIWKLTNRELVLIFLVSVNRRVVCKNDSEKLNYLFLHLVTDLQFWKKVAKWISGMSQRYIYCWQFSYPQNTKPNSTLCLRLASKKRELSEKVLSDFIKFLWFETAF
jgi:hypothetical protein